MIPTEILNYVLIRKIGEGGMGQVFLARNKNIDQFVAIKMLHPRYGNNPMLRERFRQEAIMLSTLNHPNIVKFLNYVENEHGVFLIMEYVEGQTLEDFISKKNGLIVEKRAYPMMCEILNAFAYAHGRGIIHRDIKPSNIYINKEGHIKILDFGIAQIISEVDKSVGMLSSGGTPEYMSPEQVLDRDIDIRSDIYSLGVLFHQMLTGKAPYDVNAMSSTEIKSKVVKAPLPRMKEFYPYISVGMQRVVDTATKKDPIKRYPNCADMRKEIDMILNPRPINRIFLYGGIAVGIIVLLAGFLIWDYHRTKVGYYKDYVEVWEAPEGIGSLSSREMRHRESSYRIESSKGKVRRLSLVNSAGKIVDHGDSELSARRYADVEYFYTQDGMVDYKKVYDTSGKLLYKMDYDDNLKTVIFKYDDEYGTPMRIGANTTDFYSALANGDETKASITHYLLQHDDNGRLLRKLYAGNNNERIGDNDNIYGLAYEYDKTGRVSRIISLDVEGKPRNNKFGLSIRNYVYDNDDNWTEVSYHSSDGSASHDGNNCAVVKIGYDKWGNRENEKYYDADGMPTLRTDVGVFGFTYEHDDNGNRVKTSSIDGDGKRMPTKAGYASVSDSFDENGYISEHRWLGLNDEPVLGNDAGEPVSTVRIKNDDNGRILQLSYFDTTGNPATLTTGESTIIYEYDNNGNLTKQSFFDIKGNPASYNGYQSYEIYTYDELGRRNSVKYFNDKGAPSSSIHGSYGWQIEYDRNGNVSAYKCLGADGKNLIKNNSGVATISYIYDEVGNCTSISYFDEKSSPVIVEGMCRKEMEYDPKTNLLIEERYYNTGGLTKSVKYAYDKKGNNTKTYSVGPSGNLLPGTVVNEYVYDNNGRIITTKATNLSGKSVSVPGDRYSIAKYKNDERGNCIETTFYSASGTPATDNLSTHKRIRKFDAANRQIYEKNLDVNGKPVKGSNTTAEAKVEYDSRGNQTAIYCFDGYGKAVKSHNGAHKEEYVYNERNQLVKSRMLDENGNLVNTSYGYAQYEQVFDNKGNLITMKYYKADSKLDYEIRISYNSRNNQTKLEVLNSSGKHSDSKFGFSVLEITYINDGVTPYMRKYRTASGTLIGSQKYNQAKDEWIIN